MAQLKRACSDRSFCPIQDLYNASLTGSQLKELYDNPQLILSIARQFASTSSELNEWHYNKAVIALFMRVIKYSILNNKPFNENLNQIRFDSTMYRFMSDALVNRYLVYSDRSVIERAPAAEPLLKQYFGETFDEQQTRIRSEQQARMWEARSAARTSGTASPARRGPSIQDAGFTSPATQLTCEQVEQLSAAHPATQLTCEQVEQAYQNAKTASKTASSQHLAKLAACKRRCPNAQWYLKEALACYAKCNTDADQWPSHLELVKASKTLNAASAARDQCKAALQHSRDRSHA